MLIRVHEIPSSVREFCFQSHPCDFRQVDWFTTDGHPDGENASPEDVVEFVKGKRYNRGQPLLILTSRWARTLNYTD